MTNQKQHWDIVPFTSSIPTLHSLLELTIQYFSPSAAHRLCTTSAYSIHDGIHVQITLIGLWRAHTEGLISHLNMKLNQEQKGF